jgi:hypothetical protein
MVVAGSAVAAAAALFCAADDSAVEVHDDAVVFDGARAPGEVTWRGDLNGDRIPDAIFRSSDGCGDRGECMFTVYAGCGSGHYVEVMPAEYATRVVITRARHAGWLDLVIVTVSDDRRDHRETHSRVRFDTSEAIYR